MAQLAPDGTEMLTVTAPDWTDTITRLTIGSGTDLASGIVEGTIPCLPVTMVILSRQQTLTVHI